MSMSTATTTPALAEAVALAQAVEHLGCAMRAVSARVRDAEPSLREIIDASVVMANARRYVEDQLRLEFHALTQEQQMAVRLAAHHTASAHWGDL